MSREAGSCVIAGGGPAGLMLGFLLARAGVQVTVLEKHADFLRDFRGDTIHPSTLDVIARLRPGAQLEDGVHIGNFVEVKNSRIGAGSKANHLSYLGDATIGKGVNVGAGTICCNYDGVNKSRTEIGDGAFIGSGSMLVAPVSIGADATIGAGSTITRAAPAGKLTLARGRQVTIEGWKRPTRKG